MTDKILKEAFDKLSAIEENDELEDTPYQNYKPEEANDQYDKKTGKWSRSGQYDHPDHEEIEETRDDANLHDAAIDLLDDILASLDKDNQYGEKGDVLRYAIKRLQEVGLGR